MVRTIRTVGRERTSLVKYGQGCDAGLFGLACRVVASVSSSRAWLHQWHSKEMDRRPESPELQIRNVEVFDAEGAVIC